VSTLRLALWVRKPRDVISRAPDVSPTHFKWLIAGRAANQKSTVALYEIIDSYRDIVLPDVELMKAAQDLLGIAFSLWRAVFLSDTTGDYEDQIADAEKFLVSLIADNTVLYVTDKNARNWSFRYYLDNAVYRLRELAASRLALVDGADLARMAESEKDEWLHAQESLTKAIARFETIFRA
jgi:hypothetical protein